MYILQKKKPHPKVIFNNWERRGGIWYEEATFFILLDTFYQKINYFPQFNRVIVNVDKFIVYVYYSSEMCTAFGVLKDVNISNI